jgi:hypothetical protein
MKDNVIAELAALKKMTVNELKAKWRKIMDSEPQTFNRSYLESRLAHRIQILAYGDLKPETKRRLDQLRESMTSGAPFKPHDKYRPPSGAVLVREHKGVEHRVKVLPDGFEYEGRKWRSLTAVASHIAGVHWNGPMFFGLRRKG